MSRTLLRTPSKGKRVEASRPELKVSMSVELPRESASVPLARHLTSRLLADLRVMDDVVGDVEIALSEVCTNVIDHAKVGNSYEVEVSVYGRDCEIRVIDGGKGFDDAAAGRDAGSDAERGRGLAIARAVMDRVGFDSRAGRGTLVTLAKHLYFEGDLEG